MTTLIYERGRAVETLPCGCVIRWSEGEAFATRLPLRSDLEPVCEAGRELAAHEAGALRWLAGRPSPEEAGRYCHWRRRLEAHFGLPAVGD